MRWDRLFADLEAQAGRIERDEAALHADGLSDETCHSTSWRELVGGEVVLDVRGCGHVRGEVAAINETLVRLAGDAGDVMVATRAVVEVVSTQRRAGPPSRIDQALGWPAALRRLRDADEPIRITQDGGSVVSGRIDAIGADFVRVEVPSGRRRVLLLDAIAVVAPEL